MKKERDEKVLPDIINKDLKILFVGYNPGILSAETGHHYARNSNRFWKLLYESGLTPYKISPEDDRKLLEYGYGSTNVVDRCTKNAAELTSKEFKQGSARLLELIKEIRPKIICYVGIGVYREFRAALTGVSKSSFDISTGIQKNNLLEGIMDFVCSNPSGLNTIPYSQQLECFISLRKLL